MRRYQILISYNNKQNLSVGKTEVNSNLSDSGLHDFNIQ